MIKQETISTIFETTRVEEIISDFVNLKKKGVNYVGHCPFHNEKTPSFYVSPAKGIFKCFGCQKAGNAVTFLMEHEHFSYPEALRFLAKRYNIEIEEKELSPDEIKAANIRESLFLITEFAKKFFVTQLLNTDEGKSVGLSYLEARGFNKTSIDKFELGYSPRNKTAFNKNAKKHGFKKDLLESVGLVWVKDDAAFDRFSERIIFPIHSLSGRILGFGGRTLKKEKKIAKYINSPESDIYHKSKILYGLFQGKKSIVQKNNCYLVEGYTDVIALHKSGIENCVSSSGTALTKEQIQLIKRLTSNITILYDGDDAGLKASFRGIDLILEQGLNVKIISFPENEDPDSFASKKSNEEMQTFLKNNTTDFIKFKTSIYIEEANKDPNKKTKLVRDILNSISKIPDRISRTVYIKECSNLLAIKESVLSSELGLLRRNQLKAKEQRTRNINFKKSTQNKKTTFNSQEKDIIRILINYGNESITLTKKDTEEIIKTKVSEIIIHDLTHDNFSFSTPVFQKILDECIYMLKNKQSVTLNYFTNHHDVEISNTAIQLSDFQHHLSSNWMDKHHIYIATEKENLPNAVLSSLNSFKLKMIEKLITDLREQLKDESDDTIKLKLMKALELRKEIASMLHRDI